MKKIIALLLTVVLVMSLATVAFAEGESAPAADVNDTSLWTSEAESKAIELKKVYTVTGTEKTDLFPAETLTFTSTAEGTNPDATNITIDALTVAGNANQKIVVNLPSYSKVGVYKYTIAETAGTTQGVTYTTAKLYLTVLVDYNYEAKNLNATIGITEVEEAKNDTFTNEYDVGTLSITKNVTGNLADKAKYFDITVEFTATAPVLSAITVVGGSNEANPQTIPANWANNKATANIKLKDGETLTFKDIPAGVTYTVAESDIHTTGELNGEEGYTASYEWSDEAKKIEKDDDDTVEILNTKETEVATGVMMDSVPFVVMLIVAAFGLVAFTAKKRVQE